MESFLGGDNDEIMRRIEYLPRELEFEIKNMFNMRMMKLNPVPFKHELLNLSSIEYMKFDKLFESTLGKAKAFSKIKLVLNTKESRYVKDSFNDIFYYQIGFLPNKIILNKLKTISTV